MTNLTGSDSLLGFLWVCSRNPPPPPTPQPPSVATLDNAMCMGQQKKCAVVLHALLGPLSVSCILMSVSGVYISLDRCLMFSMDSQDRFIDCWLCQDVLFLASLFLQSIFLHCIISAGRLGRGEGACRACSNRGDEHSIHLYQRFSSNPLSLPHPLLHTFSSRQ